MNENEILEKRLSILFIIILAKFAESLDKEKTLYGISPYYLRNKWESIKNTDYENLEKILHPHLREGEIIEGKEGIYENYKKLWKIK